MALKETLIHLEGYTPIEEMDDVNSLMEMFAHASADYILNTENVPIVAPLNGSILPLYYTLR